MKAMGCYQSHTIVNEGGTLKETTNNPSIGRPPKQCRGLPYALLPKLPTSLVDIDFFLPESSDGPELSCTLTWYKDASSSFPSDDPTIDDVKSMIDGGIIPAPIIIFCHGFASWRNQMLLSHLAVSVAERMDCSAIRFDFRGNGSSGGRFCYAGYAGELSDLERVVKFVHNDLGCRVACIVGHSKGSAAILQYASKNHHHHHQQQQQKQNVNEGVPCFVNISGKFSATGAFDVTKKFTAQQCNELAETGRFYLSLSGERTVEVTQEDINERQNFSVSSLVQEILASVLTIHGDADTAVDVESAYEFHKAIPRHELKIITGADHNFNGLKHLKDITSAIAHFLMSAQ